MNGTPFIVLEFYVVLYTSHSGADIEKNTQFLDTLLLIVFYRMHTRKKKNENIALSN